MATVCTITREDFAKAARGMVCELRNPGDSTVLHKLTLDAAQFSTGSLGWKANGKVDVEVDGKLVRCQVGFNLTVVGSKELPAAA